MGAGGSASMVDDCEGIIRRLRHLGTVWGRITASIRGIDDMDETLSAIIVGALSGLIGGFIFLIPFMWYVHSDTKSRKAIQERMQASHIAMYPEGKWYHVRSASEGLFAQYWKFWPWDAVGALHVDAKGVDFFGETTTHRVFELHFNKVNSSTGWTGVTLKNGNIAWFSIAQGGNKYFLTFETGMWVFGSRKATKSMYAEIEKALRN